MKNGKFAKRGVATKVLVMVLALMMVVGLSVGGTLAWLTSQTNEVVNTFTATDIKITLEETEGLTNGVWNNKVIPGVTYDKDPVVTVTSDTTVDCYLFVEFKEEGNPSTYFTYTSTLNTDNGWTQGDGTDIPSNVWYRTVGVEDATKSWHLLANDEITVKTSVTKDNMAAAAAAKLTYTAYAIQTEGFDSAAKAWDEID